MTEPDNIFLASFNTAEDNERIWKFGYRFGYYDSRRDREKKIAHLLSVLITVAVVYYGAVMITMLAYMVIQQDLSQEMVRVHEMREAYWR